jgi:hypothetical protein
MGMIMSRVPRTATSTTGSRTSRVTAFSTWIASRVATGSRTSIFTGAFGRAYMISTTTILGTRRKGTHWTSKPCPPGRTLLRSWRSLNLFWACWAIRTFLIDHRNRSCLDLFLVNLLMFLMMNSLVLYCRSWHRNINCVAATATIETRVIKIEQLLLLTWTI